MDRDPRFQEMLSKIMKKFTTTTDALLQNLE